MVVAVYSAYIYNVITNPACTRTYVQVSGQETAIGVCRRDGTAQAGGITTHGPPDWGIGCGGNI